MTRKFLSSVICLLIAASTVFAVSCADKEGSSTNSGNGTKTDTPPSDPGSTENLTFPEDQLNLHFTDPETGDVQQIVFAYSESGETGENFTLRSIEPDVEDTTVDSVDSALTDRNHTIEQAYNVDIVAEEASDSIQGLESTIQTQMSAMDPYYDVIVGYQYYDMSMAAQGWLLNYADMKDDNNGNAPINYVHYDTKDYWGRNYIDALSYKGIVYWVTGDIALRYTGGMYCTFVNARLYEQYLKDKYSDYSSIFDIVMQGKWTIDLMSEMAASVYQDDGDQVLNETDTFGYGYENNDSFDALAVASQVPYSTKTADSVTLQFATSAKSFDFVKKLELLVHGSSSLSLGDKDSTLVLPVFASGNCVFTINKVFKAESGLSDMDDDFYIIPVPKYDEAQENYTTLLHDGCSIFGISAYSDCKSAAAATLEYMAYLSYKNVRPLYYDQALKNKYTQDPNSAQMIDLIHQNINTDFALAWSESIGNIAHWYRSHNKSVGFKRQLQRYEGEWNADLDELIKTLEANATF